MHLDEIQDNQISDLSNDAKTELTKQINVYVDALLNEARLIEETLCRLEAYIARNSGEKKKTYMVEFI